jgi:hypothetical protein
VTQAGLVFRLQWLEQRRPGHWLALASSALCACLDSPPTYAPRGQRPPFVIAGQVLPPIGAVYEGPLPVQINVPFRSEDVNTPLLASLYQDLVPGANAEGVQTIQKDVPAGIYEDTERSVAMEWRLPLEGCHSLTLILTYVDNFVAAGPLDDTLAARVVWWLNMDDVDGDVTMSSCPGSTQSSVVQ